MRVIIAGGRDYVLTESDRTFLDALHKAIKIEEVVSGGAPGADRGGELWAKSRGLRTTVFKANWETDGKKAGPLRNQKMVNYADMLVAFPGNRGTQDCITRAMAKGLQVFEPMPYEGAELDDVKRWLSY